MCPLSREKDFGLVDSILIIDEAQELSLEEYALETLFTVDFRNLKVTMGPIEFKIRPNNIDDFVSKEKIIWDGISGL